jgi:hypothetical protein
MRLKQSAALLGPTSALHALWVRRCNIVDRQLLAGCDSPLRIHFDSPPYDAQIAIAVAGVIEALEEVSLAAV